MNPFKIIQISYTHRLNVVPRMIKDNTYIIRMQYLNGQTKKYIKY